MIAHLLASAFTWLSHDSSPPTPCSDNSTLHPESSERKEERTSAPQSAFTTFVPISEPGTLEQIVRRLRASTDRRKDISVIGSLTESFENQILLSLGIAPKSRTEDEYLELFRSLGLSYRYGWTGLELLTFSSIEELRAWIYAQLGDERLVDECLSRMLETGLVDVRSDEIRFPVKRLLAYLTLTDNPAYHFFPISEPGALERLVRTMQPGDTIAVTGSVSDSFENEVFKEIGGVPKSRTMEEYRTLFKSLGLKPKNVGGIQLTNGGFPQYHPLTFSGIAELRAWIYSQLEDEVLTEECLYKMYQKEGLIGWGEGVAFRIYWIVAWLTRCE